MKPYSRPSFLRKQESSPNPRPSGCRIKSGMTRPQPIGFTLVSIGYILDGQKTSEDAQ